MSTQQQPQAPHPADMAEESSVEGPIFDNASVALQAVDRAAIDSQIATAKAHPRSMKVFLSEARSLACLDEETAQSMFYTLKRKDQNGRDTYINGPSVRLAEIVAYAYQNLRIDGDIESEDAKFLTAVGTCFDLERNVAMRTRVRRRITTKHGKRYGDDMIAVTANAAISIAVRNAIVRVVPRVFINQLFEAARKTALGDAKTLSSKRLNALAWFDGQGVPKAEIFKILNVKGVEDIGEEQYLTLVGLSNSIKEGTMTIAELLRPAGQTEDAADLNAAIKEASGTPKPADVEDDILAQDRALQQEEKAREGKKK